MNIMFVQSDKYNPKGLSKHRSVSPALNQTLWCKIRNVSDSALFLGDKLNKQICDIDLVNFVQSS